MPPPSALIELTSEEEPLGSLKADSSPPRMLISIMSSSSSPPTAPPRPPRLSPAVADSSPPPITRRSLPCRLSLLRRRHRSPLAAAVFGCDAAVIGDAAASASASLAPPPPIPAFVDRCCPKNASILASAVDVPPIPTPDESCRSLCSRAMRSGLSGPAAEALPPIRRGEPAAVEGEPATIALGSLAMLPPAADALAFATKLGTSCCSTS